MIQGRHKFHRLTRTKHHRFGRMIQVRVQIRYKVVNTPYDTVQMYHYDASATATRTTSIVFVRSIILGIRWIFILGRGWSHDIRRSSLSQITTTAITICTHAATSSSGLSLSLTHTKVFLYVHANTTQFCCCCALSNCRKKSKVERKVKNHIGTDFYTPQFKQSILQLKEVAHHRIQRIASNAHSAGVRLRTRTKLAVIE